jgi:transposase
MSFVNEKQRSGKKRGIRRRLKRKQPGDVMLFTDWTLLRLFPPLRAAWSRVGEQARVPVTGRNAKRVLFGAINVQTGHRVVLGRKRAGGADARVFLAELRQRYRKAPTIWLLLDRAPAHTDAKTLRLAVELGIELMWLPKQWPELNAMDQLWKELKRLLAANRQAVNIDELAEKAADWGLQLRPREALRKAGILSPTFWLRGV